MEGSSTVSVPISNFTELSKKLTKQIKDADIKKGGIYFTPQSIIKRNIEIIKTKTTLPHSKITILEPSCGSGEFINIVNSEFTNSTITGIELNKEIYKEIVKPEFKLSLKSESDSNNNNKIEPFINKDYTKWEDKRLFDLIIGNPPYFVMKKSDIPGVYLDDFDGRPNIFVLFMLISLKKLKPDGILSFVLPTSFLNCLYYDKLRSKIFNEYKIIDIINCDDDKYLETQQNTIIFIVQNRQNEASSNKNFTLLINNYTIFNTIDKIKILNELLVGATTLSEYNFDVNVGNIVWNQHKDILTDDNTKTRLIYNSDIIKNKLDMIKYKNEDKKNYIDLSKLDNKKSESKPLLVMNRGYGKGTYKLDYCLIEIDNYVIENHLICIRSSGDTVDTIEGTGNQALIKKYKKIMKSFKNPKTTKFIETYFGNAAINTMELKHILPLYI